MDTWEGGVVHGEGGLRGMIEGEGQPGAAEEGRVAIRLDDGRLLIVPSEMLRARGDGSFDLHLSRAEYDAAAVGGVVGAAVGEASGEELTVPVVREEVEFSRREVETGRVCIRKLVREHERVVDEPIVREDVEVERVPVERWVDGPVEPRNEGDTLIIPLLEEVLVVEKRLRVREEVRITRRRREHRDPRTLSLRTEEVVVDRSGGSGPGPSGEFIP